MAVWLGVHKVNFLESSVPVGTIDVSLNITYFGKTGKQTNNQKQQKSPPQNHDKQSFALSVLFQFMIYQRYYSSSF